MSILKIDIKIKMKNVLNKRIKSRDDVFQKIIKVKNEKRIIRSVKMIKV